MKSFYKNIESSFPDILHFLFPQVYNFVSIYLQWYI